MTINRNITKFIIILFGILISGLYKPCEAQTIVFAGADTGICDEDELLLSDLMATIIGTVSDGTWLSAGDGVFMPDGTNSGVFSTSTSYKPGPLDIQLGNFTLTLASDPDPSSGAIITDQVNVVLLDEIAMSCNNFINLSVNYDCEVEILANHLINNPTWPLSMYHIELTEENGTSISGTTLDGSHIGQMIGYSIEHSCTGVSCWGQIMIGDFIAPLLDCSPDTISCLLDSDPISVGFPLNDYDSYLQQDADTYILIGGDNCGNAVLSYSDNIVDQLCSSDFESIIERSWTGMDSRDNESNCIQLIYIEKYPLEDVVFPDNWDGGINPVLDCSVTYPEDGQGNPSPDYTGEPILGNCTKLNATYEDVIFESCGDTYNVLRSWHVLDWCTNESLASNQLIKIQDTLSPEIICIEEYVVTVDNHNCNISDQSVEIPIISDNCSDWSLSCVIYSGVNIIDIELDISSPNLSLPNLTVGMYTLEWKAEDVCNNISLCTSILIVQDLSPPNMVCKEDFQLSLGQSGTGLILAEDFDNGSYDNCSSLTFDARKMTDVCYGNLDFVPAVTFCCEEIGDTVLVELRATDMQGLSNFCMVMVTIDDKLAPTLNCPSDLTISCQLFNSTYDYNDFGKVATHIDSIQAITIYDAYNNGVVGGDGYVTDNCGYSLSDSTYLDINCDEGTLYRYFTAVDSFGNSNSCHQTITILNGDSFQYEDIEWPSDYENIGCDTTQTDPTITGVPTLDVASCALVSSSYIDQVFFFTPEACLKVIRSWTVVDWCQFEDDQNSGIWHYEQIIKLQNDVDPEFVDNCEALELCITSSSCGQIFTFTTLGSDDCTQTENLVYGYKLDVDRDGSFEKTGNAATFNFYMEPGIATVHWTVEDKCGNISFCEQDITVIDCKAPTPYCISSITSVISENEPTEIWATDFELNTSDNCTDFENINISFAPDEQIDFLEFTCDDLANGVAEAFDLQVWYTDEAGNQEFCTVEFVVQDNGDHCEDGVFSAELYGTILNSNLEQTAEVQLYLEAAIEDYSEGVFLDNSTFVVPSLVENLQYDLQFSKDDSYLKGVSTLDILLIQNHILGTIPFTSNYNLLAADVNGSESVTGVDLVTIRKLILGKLDSFPNPYKPWRYVKRIDTIAAHDPWLLSNEHYIRASSAMDSLHLIAVKQGDVNGSASFSSGNGDVKFRTNKDNVKLEYDDETNKINFHFTEQQDITGLQLSFEVGENVQFVNSKLPNFDERHYSIIDGLVRLSWTNSTVLYWDSEEPFLSLSIEDPTQFAISNRLDHRYYTEDGEVEINYKKRIGHNTEGSTAAAPISIVYQNGNQVVFTLNDIEDQDLSIQLYTLDGKIIASKKVSGYVSGHEIALDIHSLSIAQIAILTIKGKDFYQSKKFPISFE
jgi:hypothetical protein